MLPEVTAEEIHFWIVLDPMRGKVLIHFRGLEPQFLGNILAVVPCTVILPTTAGQCEYDLIQQLVTCAVGVGLILFSLHSTMSGLCPNVSAGSSPNPDQATRIASSGRTIH
jgi:hypothetical protein